MFWMQLLDLILFCLLSNCTCPVYMIVICRQHLCGVPATGQRFHAWLNKTNTEALLESKTGKPKLLAVVTGCDGWWLSLAWMCSSKSQNDQAQSKPACVRIFGEKGSVRTRGDLNWDQVQLNHVYRCNVNTVF